MDRYMYLTLYRTTKIQTCPVKALAGDNSNLSQTMGFRCERVEIQGGLPALSPFSTIF